MKKALLLFSLLLVVIFASVCLGSCGVLLDKAGFYEDYEYVVDSEYEITITGYKGENTKIEIPAWIDGYKVVGIDFDENDETLHNIESIKIPKTIISLSSETFLPCVNLKEITVALDNPEYKYFKGALYSKDGKKLICYPQAAEEEELELHKRVESIAPRAFLNARYLKSIKLTSVAEIGELAFVGCSALESVDFGESLRKIGYGAFENCTLISALELPDTTEYISEAAFGGCIGVGSVRLGNNVTHVGSGAFENLDTVEGLTEFGGAMYLGNSENPYVVLVKAIDSERTAYHVHSSTNVIYESAFEGMSALEAIEIPHHMTEIGRRAFYNCVSLRGVELPEGMSTVEEYAFYGCSSISALEIPSSITDIEASAFEGCSALTSLTLSNRTRTVGNRAFAGCTSLSSVEIPGTVTYIADSSFLECESLVSVAFAAAEGWTCNLDNVNLSNLSDPVFAASLIKQSGIELVRAES